MGDVCGSGTGLDPDSIFYCASLSLYYFMFTALLSSCVLLLPGELAKHAVSEVTKAVTNPATGAIFLSNPEESEGRRGGGGRGRTVGGSEGWDDG